MHWRSHLWEGFNIRWSNIVNTDGLCLSTDLMEDPSSVEYATVLLQSPYSVSVYS